MRLITVVEWYHGDLVVRKPVQQCVRMSSYISSLAQTLHSIDFA
jgi:hypothetical protein